MAKLTARIIDSAGKVRGYLLGNRQRVTMTQVVKMAEQGKLPGIHAVAPKGRRPYIRSDADGNEKNNLGKLPPVEK